MTGGGGKWKEWTWVLGGPPWKTFKERYIMPFFCEGVGRGRNRRKGDWGRCLRYRVGVDQYRGEGGEDVFIRTTKESSKNKKNSFDQLQNKLQNLPTIPKISGGKKKRGIRG